MAARKKVNLLVREGFEYTTVGRTLNWALSAGRIIVIVTELIVIIAFLSRFWLDRTLTDLNRLNVERQAQVEAASSFEKDFRDAQARLSAYQRLDKNRIGAADLMLEAAALLPAEVSLTNISLSGQEITFTGLALSEAGLAGFLRGLQDSESFTNANLSDVSFGLEAQTLKFTIKAAIGGGSRGGN